MKIQNMHINKDFIGSDQFSMKFRYLKYIQICFIFLIFFRYLQTLYVSWRLESAINSNVFQIYAKNYDSIKIFFRYYIAIVLASNPLQLGPICVLTPWKCAIFGVCCEAIPCQSNFLIDETLDMGKGANSVISMLHFYLENHDLNAVRLHLNADNCCGQNKNNAMIQVNHVIILLLS